MKNLKRYLWVICYLLCVIYITIISRTVALVHIVKPIPFWSYADWLKGNWPRGFSIALNIVLFVPLGYLLAGMSKRRLFFPIVISIGMTVMIEVIQYLTYRGYFDVDDIISNALGGMIGIAFFKLLGEKKFSKVIPYVLVFAGFVGCLLTGGTKQIYETQFDFYIDSITVEDEHLTISGTCDIYHRGELPYQVLLINEEGVQVTKTVIDRERFLTELKPADGELYVQFQGYQPIATSVYVKGNEIAYVPPSTPAPELTNTDLEFLIHNGTLKVYNAKYGTYLYQVKNRLYWLIGKDFDANIIYHLYTDEPENLPENRQQSGFDNRAVQTGSEKELTSTINCGNYRVFTDIIPEEYHILAIATGMKSPSVFWREFFRPNKY